MGEIRSPYFSCGGSYYLGENAEIQSPYVSYGTRGYHGDNAEIHSSHFSVGDYDGEDAEIPSEAFFHQDDNFENPYNAEQDIVQNVYHTGNLIQTKTGEEWGINIAALDAKLEEIEEKPEEKPEEKCIRKVSEAFRKSKGNIYTPRQISIGPIHHGNKNLRSMEKRKVNYFKELCKRVAEERNEQKKFEGQLWKIIADNKDRIERCYGDGDHKLEGDEFLTVVLIDAVFILEYLLRYAYITTYEDKESREKKYGNDSILREMRFWIRWDLMLLENQLPFFILDELYECLPLNVRGKYPLFRDLAYYYFDRHIPRQRRPEIDYILHFTDLVRSLLSLDHPPLTTGDPIGKYYRATQLHEAGIKIKKSRDKCLLHIQFSSTKSELSIPRLVLDNYTECIFGNLLAFEKYHCQGKEYICHYLKFFDTLIDKPKDAALLIKNNIIDTSKDGAKVKAIIEKLSAETSEDSSCYINLYTQIDRHYEDSWGKNRLLYLKKTYFGNVWKGTATLAATTLLILSLIQTICSVISVRQNS